MARHIQKRKRSSGLRPMTKKRKFARKSRRTMSTTSQAGRGVSTIRFSARRMSKRKWKTALWNATMFKTHYRSINSFATIVNSPAGGAAYTTAVFPALRFLAQPFYISTGGAISNDLANPVPTFDGDVILRGGTIGMTIANNPTDADALTVCVMLIATSAGYNATAIPATVSIGWEPSLIPNFQQQVGRILLRKEFLIQNANSVDVQYKLPIRKFQPHSFINDEFSYVWVVLVSSPSGTAESVTITRYLNCSFCADGQ